MGSDDHVNGYMPTELRLGPLTPVPSWRPKLKVEPRNRQPGQVLSVLEAEEVKALQKLNGMDIHTLLQALVPIAAEIALPYISGFYVGAVGLGASGRIFMGGNLEFPGASLASSVHAEQCLLANVLRHGGEELLAVAISAPPCGHCRQFFSEMCCADEVELIFGEGPQNVYKLRDILPHRFGPHDLLTDPHQPLLLQRQHHDLRFSSGATAILDRRKGDARFEAAAAAALGAARSCYTPYNGSPAAVALVTHAGIHAGGLVENAAHNPTLQPLQAALAAAALDGVKDYVKIELAVLVETRGTILRQGPTAQALLRTVAPKAEFAVLFIEPRS